MNKKIKADFLVKKFTKKNAENLITFLRKECNMEKCKISEWVKNEL